MFYFINIILFHTFIYLFIYFIRDRAYEVPGKGGNNFYFFNFCGEVSQGACTPHQAVCQVGDILI